MRAISLFIGYALSIITGLCMGYGMQSENVLQCIGAVLATLLFFMFGFLIPFVLQ